MLLLCNVTCTSASKYMQSLSKALTRALHVQQPWSTLYNYLLILRSTEKKKKKKKKHGHLRWWLFRTLNFMGFGCSLKKLDYSVLYYGPVENDIAIIIHRLLAHCLITQDLTLYSYQLFNFRFYMEFLHGTRYQCVCCYIASLVGYLLPLTSLI